MGRYVVMLYEGRDKPVGEKSGAFASIDAAVHAIAGHNLVTTGDAQDLRAIAWAEDNADAPQKISYYLPQYVGADSE